MVFFRDPPPLGGLVVHADNGCDRTRLREGRAGRSLTFSVTCLLVTSLTSSQEKITNYTFSESSKLVQYGGNLLNFFKLLFSELLTVYSHTSHFLWRGPIF